MNHINDVNPNRYNCSGCSACMSACPKGCITMNKDEEGFAYPEVDTSLCINCGACVKACIWTKDKPEAIKNYPLVYAAKNKCDEIRSVSTSGGMFTALATEVLLMGGVAYGASFVPESQRVEHISVAEIKNLHKLRGSKYVQSWIGNCYKEIREQLKNGKTILFTGTPCQCAGLRTFLNKDYDNLIIVDILCHSVPSPKVFEDVLLSYGNKVSNISFRDKKLGWRGSYHFQIFQGEKSFTNETYLTMLFKWLTNRPSCYHCRFTSTVRPSDITIGDYWNIKAVNPSFEDRLGVSCLLINNGKGKLFFDKISDSLDFVQTPLEPAIQVCMSRNVKEPRSRKRFWKDYKKEGIKFCEEKYGYKTIWERLRDNQLAPIVRKIKKMLKS